MPVKVTIDYFSGIPNPGWKLPSERVAEVARRLAALPTGSLEQFPKHFPLVGYNGIHVTATNGELPDFEIWNERVIENGRVPIVRVDRARRLEQFLIEATAPPSIERDFGLTFATLTKARDKQPIAGLPGTGPFGGLECESSPSFTGDIAPWNDPMLGNNCYSYANNESAPLGIDVPIPGRHDNNVNFTVTALRTGAREDKLTKVSNKTLLKACPTKKDSHYLVICLREQTGLTRDFHCLRLDADGTWSHKDGIKKVRQTDDTLAPITDLRTARFSNQMTFVGLFVSTKGTRKIFQA